MKSSKKPRLDDAQYRKSAEATVPPCTSTLEQLPVELLADIARRLPRRELNALRSCSRFWRDVLDSIPALWRTLAIGRLVSAARPTSAVLHAIVAQSRFRHISKLILPTDCSLQMLSSFLSTLQPSLKELVLPLPCELSTPAAGLLAPYLSELRSLVVPYTSPTPGADVNPAVFAAFGPLRNLTQLRTSGQPFSLVVACDPSPDRLQVLQVLEVKAYDPTAQSVRPWTGFDAISAFTALTDLRLHCPDSDTPPVPGDGDYCVPLRCVSPLVRLRNLYLLNCPVDDYLHISTLTGLKTLRINVSEDENGDPVTFPMHSLESLTALRELHVGGCLCVPSDTGRLVSVLSALEELTVGDLAFDVPVDFWYFFASYDSPHLRTLNAVWIIDQVALENVLRGIRRCPKLQKFDCIFGSEEEPYELSVHDFVTLCRVPSVCLRVRSHLLLPADMSDFEVGTSPTDWPPGYPVVKQLATSLGVLTVRLHEEAQLSSSLPR